MLLELCFLELLKNQIIYGLRLSIRPRYSHMFSNVTYGLLCV